MIEFELDERCEAINIYVNGELVQGLQTLNFKDSVNELIADLHNELLDLHAWRDRNKDD
jgi:hypothetical protein